MWCEWEVRLGSNLSHESYSPETPCSFLLFILMSFPHWKHIRETFPGLKGQKTLWSLSRQFVGTIAKGLSDNNWPLRVSKYQPFHYRHTALSDNWFSKGKIPVMTKGLGVTPCLHLGLITGEPKSGSCIIPNDMSTPQDSTCLSRSSLQKPGRRFMRPLSPFPWGSGLDTMSASGVSWALETLRCLDSWLNYWSGFS